MVNKKQAVARIASRTAKNCRGHVTQATPTFRENYLCARSAFQTHSCIQNLKSLAQVDFEIFNVKCNAMVDVILIRPLNKRARSFILVPINLSYTTSYRLNSNFCSRTHRLATIHNVTDDDRQTTTTDDGRTQVCSISATVLSTVG